VRPISPHTRSKKKLGFRVRSRANSATDLFGARAAIARWPSQDMLLFRGCCAQINHQLTALPHLHYPHYCNTIARLLCNIIPPPTPFLYVIRHTILEMAISCKGQILRRCLGPTRRRLLRFPSSSHCLLPTTILREEKQVTHTNTQQEQHTTRQEQHHKRPHEEPSPPALNNDRRWRGDGAYHRHVLPFFVRRLPRSRRDRCRVPTRRRARRSHLYCSLYMYTDGLYTKSTRAHTHRELIREWLWDPKGSSLR